MESTLSAFAEPISRAIPRLPQLIISFAVGVVVLYLFLWFFERLLKLVGTPATLEGILNSIARVVLWVILIASIFQAAGLPQVALALSSTLAITGVALGAGANGLVQDIIAGLFLARDRDFSTGFLIKSGEIEGRIRRMDMRKIRIEDKKGQIHVVPTSMLDKTSWVVLSRERD